MHKKGIELEQEGENKSENKSERGRFNVLISGTIPTYIMECFLGVGGDLKRSPNSSLLRQNSITLPQA